MDLGNVQFGLYTGTWSAKSVNIVYILSCQPNKTHVQLKRKFECFHIKNESRVGHAMCYGQEKRSVSVI